MYYTYIVASRSRNLYVGMSGELQVRVWQHKNGVFEGYSKLYRCDRLVWFERHPEVRAAIAREKQLKGWRREKKIWLIERENPTWAGEDVWGGVGRTCKNKNNSKCKSKKSRSFDCAALTRGSAQNDNYLISS